MYLCLELLGQAVSCSLDSSGAPTECNPLTNSPSVPSAWRTFAPTRAMMCMLATTYGESLISTPIFEIGEPSGPMQYGMTYMVRPRIDPVKSCVSFSLIFPGSSQLLLGPASSFVAEQM